MQSNFARTQAGVSRDQLNKASGSITLHGQRNNNLVNTALRIRNLMCRLANAIQLSNTCIYIYRDIIRKTRLQTARLNNVFCYIVRNHVPSSDNIPRGGECRQRSAFFCLSKCMIKVKTGSAIIKTAGRNGMCIEIISISFYRKLDYLYSKRRYVNDRFMFDQFLVSIILK